MIHRMNSRGTSNHTDNERSPRMCEDLPRSLRHTAFSNSMDGSPRHYAQSARYENTGAERTRVHYSSRCNEEGSINNDSAVIQIRPEPISAIYEPVLNNDVLPDSHLERRTRSEGLRTHYSIVNNGAEGLHILPPPNRAISEVLLEDVVLSDSPPQRVSGSDSLNIHYSADNTGTEGDTRNRKLTKLQIAVRVIFILMVIFILISFIARFTEPRSASPITVTLVSMFLTLGCFAIYILTMFCKICMIPCNNEVAGFDF